MWLQVQSSPASYHSKGITEPPQEAPTPPGRSTRTHPQTSHSPRITVTDEPTGSTSPQSHPTSDSMQIQAILDHSLPGLPNHSQGQVLAPRLPTVSPSLSHYCTQPSGEPSKNTDRCCLNCMAHKVPNTLLPISYVDMSRTCLQTQINPAELCLRSHQ